MSYLSDLLICASLFAVLMAATCWLCQRDNRPPTLPPPADADEEAADVDTDALPFGPAPRDSN